MNLRQLHYFMHIARLGSFSRASEYLHIAQPALSRHMREMETEIGMPLFVRHGRGAVPTAAGMRLLKHAKKVLQTLDEAKQDLASLVDRPREIIRLGVPPAVSEALSAELLDRLRERFPYVSLHITETWTGHIRELLIEKKIDFGILSVPQVNRSFRCLPLVDEAVHLVSSTEHQPRKKTWQLKDLSSVPLVLAPAPHGSRLVIDQMLRKHGVKAKIVLESEVWSVIKDVVQKGIACTLVPRREVREEIKRGSLKAETIIKPEIRHKLLLARLAKGAHTPFDTEVFEFLAPCLQQALVVRAKI